MCFYTIKLFAEKYPAFNETKLRNIHFNRFQNGSEFAFAKAGKTVLIHEEKFLKWIELQSQRSRRGKITSKDFAKLTFSEIENKILADKDHLIQWMESVIEAKVIAYLTMK